MDNSHWTLDKRISISHIITTVTVAVAVVLAFSDLKSDIRVFGARLDAVEETTKYNLDLRDRVVKLEVLLNRIDTTLDRLNKKLDEH